MARIALCGIDAQLARDLKRSGHTLIPMDAESSVASDVEIVLINWDDDQSPLRISHIRTLDRHIPILALVNTGDQADLALRSGATDIIQIPVRTSILISRLALHAQARMQFTELRDLRAKELLTTSQGLRMASEISHAHDFLERLIDASPDPIIAAEESGLVLLFNRAAEQLLGYSSQEAQARLHIHEIYAEPRDASQVLMSIRSSPHGRCDNFRTRLRSRNGEQIPILLSAAEVHDRDGETVATVGVFRDTRASDLLTSRLRQATNQLIESEKRSAATELAGATAHELNQPLTSVMGILELAILKAEGDQEHKLRLESAYKQLERMADIVRSLSRITRYRTKDYVEGVEILDLDPPTNF